MKSKKNQKFTGNPPSGRYWDLLKKLGLKNYMILNGEIVVVKWVEFRTHSSYYGNRTVPYYRLEDSRLIRTSEFNQIKDPVKFSRKIKIEIIEKGDENYKQYYE